MFKSSVDKDAFDKAPVIKVSSNEEKCFKSFAISCSEVKLMMNNQKVSKKI